MSNWDHGSGVDSICVVLLSRMISWDQAGKRTTNWPTSGLLCDKLHNLNGITMLVSANEYLNLAFQQLTLFHDLMPLMPQGDDGDETRLPLRLVRTVE